MSYQHKIGTTPTILIYIVITVFSVACLIPFLFILSGSFTDEMEIIHKGFTLIPTKTSYSSWVMLSHDLNTIVNGYIITVSVTVVGTFLSLLVTSLMAYPLSVTTLRYRNVIAFFAFFTMIFSGGIVPWYIIVSNVLHLRNTFLALILPYTINAWNMFLLRNFFRTIPKELAESAKIRRCSGDHHLRQAHPPPLHTGACHGGPFHRPGVLERLVAEPDVHREPASVSRAAHAAGHHLQRAVPPHLRGPDHRLRRQPNPPLRRGQDGHLPGDHRPDHPPVSLRAALLHEGASSWAR